MKVCDLWRAWSYKMAEARDWKRKALDYERTGNFGAALRAHTWQRLASETARRYAARARRARNDDELVPAA